VMRAGSLQQFFPLFRIQPGDERHLVHLAVAVAAQGERGEQMYVVFVRGKRSHLGNLSFAISGGWM
jgi:hypothetical protein